MEPLIITTVTFICTSPTLDSSYLKEGFRKDKDKKNISPWGPACKWGMFATCLQPVQALPVFTLHFSWQLSANGFCQLFHVQSWKSAKLNSFSIRSFTVWLLGCRAFSVQPCLSGFTLTICDRLLAVNFWTCEWHLHSAYFEDVLCMFAFIAWTEKRMHLTYMCCMCGLFRRVSVSGRKCWAVLLVLS